MARVHRASQCSHKVEDQAHYIPDLKFGFSGVITADLKYLSVLNRVAFQRSL